ncbi:NB-ARC domain-containing protein [Dolichospermum lemmermannii CS-548]|uniref:NB-ARC domain-containing protein n=1 Tax=Dolichospermum lemmermannii TaxID=54295 RepID=UPI00232E4DD2|nr:NB-ARC domain-containing protein [Dolichospermum lemmermannii]MDB9439102.1 NB-ARC domain-containing protein [Dolichospermum lemmermannii CS-548]
MIDVKEVLQFADELVFVQTGKHLDDIQDTVIKGVWQGQTYEKIAKQCHRSESHVRDVGYKLWQVFSEQLDEDINKYNFRSTFQRLHIQSSQNRNICHINGSNHHFHFNPQILYNTKQDNQENITKNQSQTSSHDLTIAPKITHFYGRETELQTLSHWLTNQNNRLVSILGLPGIGKTTLVKHFIDLNLQQFDLVIWKNIKLSHSLDNILTEIFIFTNPDYIETDNKLTQFFNLLRQKRCLIIIDDIQDIFSTGQVAGKYKPEYKDYKTFFAKITEIEHQSSLILISQEKCQEMICIDEESYPVKCLELQDLDTTDILKTQKLKDEENWSNLIKLYEGNPVYLQDISSLIRNIFQGKISDFLSEGLLLTENMKYQLSELFNRLSTVEQQIVLEMSKSNQPVNREQLRESLSLSSMELINGLQSLKRRYLVTTIESDKTLFILSPVFREYVIITP